MTESSNPESYRGLSLSSFVPLINSLFSTAGVGVGILELSLSKEEVVVGFGGQIEDWEHELSTVEGIEDLEFPARYLAEARLRVDDREIPVYVRFYLSSEQKLVVEDFGDNGTSLIEEAEAQNPSKWENVVERASEYGPLIVRVILSYWNIN